ncbi:hypothetical protein BD779DRAFT_460197 [Infundibulicybe gibba]|nr:hypothetical protein BD779DRAFT_460197 [Infundibulicybe gibba]
MQSILLFIRNSSAERLTSLTLNGIRCSLQQLIDLSTLIPMVTDLDLCEIGGDSLQLLTIKSDSPHDILFPRLERLVIRYYTLIYPYPELSNCSNVFHSRLYLAPNTTIIENVSPLQHAELHLFSLFVDCDLLDVDELDRLSDKHAPQRLIRRLRSVYWGTVGFNTKTIHCQDTWMKEIHRINRYILPAPHELGHYEGRLPTGETTRFFRKLDAAFVALEGYHVTHPLEILVHRANKLMHEFSCLPETSFLHNPAYNFHLRAARLLKQWQPMIREYEARDRWTCEYDVKMKLYKIVHRRAVDI